VIDAHIHFWDPARRDDILIVQREPSLNIRAMPEELAPLLAAAGVDAAIAIQSAPNGDETDHLIETSAKIPAIKGVVGWVDLTAPDVAAQLMALAERPKVKGVRAMLNRVDGADWLTRAAVQTGVAAVREAGLSLDLITRTEHIPAVAKTAAAFPDLTIIVDHGASPPSGKPGFAEWQAGIEMLGAHKRVFTKFSGLAEEAAPDWNAKTLEPALRHLLKCFGPDRLMWASNWPVIDLRGGYARWVAESRALLDNAGLSAAGRRAIEDTTARTAYRIDATKHTP
jgi:L-fuconolactonase